MPTRNVNLTDHFDRFVADEVKSGRYSNASEVVREGLRLMERRRQEEKVKLGWLRGAVQVGLDQIGSGACVEFESLNALDREIDRIGREVSAGARRRKRA